MSADVQRKVDDFVKRYPFDFTFNYDRAEQLSTKDPAGKNILHELNEALDQYIVFSSASPSPPAAMAIRCALLINRAFSYGVIKDKNLSSNGTQDLSIKLDIQKEQSLFLQKLYEKADYNPSKSIDAYVVGREIGFGEDKIDTLTSRLLAKEFLTKGDIFPINTGDPLPSRKYLLVRLSAKGMAKMDNDSAEPSSNTSFVHNDNRRVNVNVNKAANPRIQVGGDNSRQILNNVGIDVEKLKMVFQDVRGTIDRTSLDPKVRAIIISAEQVIEQELSTSNPKKESLLSKIKSFLAKIKYIPALAVVEEKILMGLDESGIDVSNYFF